MLAISKVETFYGNIQALRGVNVKVNNGEIVALIGSNGAGKSTLLMTVSGVNKAAAGEIVFNNVRGNIPTRLKKLLPSKPTASLSYTLDSNSSPNFLRKDSTASFILTFGSTLLPKDKIHSTEFLKIYLGFDPGSHSHDL